MVLMLPSSSLISHLPRAVSRERTTAARPLKLRAVWRPDSCTLVPGCSASQSTVAPPPLLLLPLLALERTMSPDSAIARFSGRTRYSLPLSVVRTSKRWLTSWTSTTRQRVPLSSTWFWSPQMVTMEPTEKGPMPVAEASSMGWRHVGQRASPQRLRQLRWKTWPQSEIVCARPSRGSRQMAQMSSPTRRPTSSGCRYEPPWAGTSSGTEAGTGAGPAAGSASTVTTVGSCSWSSPPASQRPGRQAFPLGPGGPAQAQPV
mmetsp:Transcript_75653/g.244784  ORF Transcript_75653/g.244784 Transcript_75653/m.244784 type:complete len:260 (-) Transcript_75653:89-868(-)